MRIIVLTTETAHHAHFVREIARTFPPVTVLVEKRVARPPFETHHPFEERRDAHERNTFFGGNHAAIRDFAETVEVHDVNKPASVSVLEQNRADAVIVFGTGLIRAQTIRACADRIVNLHGGDPEEYRGLDTHLWAIYHGDFGGLVTTLHAVNETLDGGDILLQGRVPLAPGMKLHELRAANTALCVELALAALDMQNRLGRFISRPQRKHGRYYSFMPAALKEVCLRRFETHQELMHGPA